MNKFWDFITLIPFYIISVFAMFCTVIYEWFLKKTK